MGLGYFTARARSEDVRPAKFNTNERPVVLVIDDDPNILDALEHVLRTKYRVRLSSSGERGLTLVDEFVSVVVLDVKMPGMDGFQVSQSINARSPQVPIIFYSAYQNILDMDQLRREHNPFGYFDKDGSIDGLLECIEAAVQKPSATQSC